MNSARSFMMNLRKFTWVSTEKLKLTKNKI